MDITSLKIFSSAATTRSFVATGRLMGISASGIGKSITRLEEEMGIRLFHRSTRSIALTIQGEMLLVRVHRILAEIESAKDELTKESNFPEGKLRIGLPLVGEPFLNMFSEFRRRYPRIALDLEFDNRKADVIEEGYDAVIRTGSAHDSRLSSRLLGAFRMVVVGSPAYFSQAGIPLIPEDLHHHTCIQFRMPETGKLQLWKFRADFSGLDISMQSDLICNSNEARLHFTMEGLGISYMPEYSVIKELTAGTLVEVLNNHVLEENFFRLLWPSGKYITPRLRQFIDFLVENFKL